MKIVFLDQATVGNLPNIEKFKAFGQYQAYDYTSSEQTAQRVADADVVITNKVVIDKQIMENCPKLKLICVAATGTNNIDLEAAQRLNIPVKNVAGYSTNSVVQITFALLMELMCHTSTYNTFIQSGDYSKGQSFTLLTPQFWELSGKRFGIVGLGAIGGKVAQIAEAFGAEVVYYSTSGANNNAQYKRVEMQELLESCDVISIHAPLNDKTNNLFDYAKLSQMKQNALILNLGRGGIINEEDLVQILDEGKIAGAGIDVFTKEPMLVDSPYLKLINKGKLVATPHIAWASVEARTLLVDLIVENIKNSGLR